MSPRAKILEGWGQLEVLQSPKVRRLEAAEGMALTLKPVLLWELPLSHYHLQSSFGAFPSRVANRMAPTHHQNDVEQRFDIVSIPVMVLIPLSNSIAM